MGTQFRGHGEILMGMFSTCHHCNSEWCAGECQYNAGLQHALDIVTKATDWLQAHPDHHLDMFDVLARIITDIQVAEKL